MHAYEDGLKGAKHLKMPHRQANNNAEVISQEMKENPGDAILRNLHSLKENLHFCASNTAYVIKFCT